MTSWGNPVPAPTLVLGGSLKWKLLDNDQKISATGFKQGEYNYRLTPHRTLSADFLQLLHNQQDSSFERARMVFASARAVEVLRKLADKRQAPFTGKPRQNGSNLLEVRRMITYGDEDRQIASINGSQTLSDLYQHLKRTFALLTSDDLQRCRSSIPKVTLPPDSSTTVNLKSRSPMIEKRSLKDY